MDDFLRAEWDITAIQTKRKTRCLHFRHKFLPHKKKKKNKKKKRKPRCLHI